jgi:hypothetical protein
LSSGNLTLDRIAHQAWIIFTRKPTADQGLTSGSVIPAEHIVPTWDLMYFIEAMDNRGHGRIHPDLNKEAPYVVVSLLR